MKQIKQNNNILFVCQRNALRSPIAQALAKHLYINIINSQSAGLFPENIDPFAAAIMSEIGIDIAHHKPNTIENALKQKFQHIISLAPEAHHKILSSIENTDNIKIQYWPTLDPSMIHGNREQKIHAYRQVREQLKQKIKQYIIQNIL